jgi:hypothetical protein
LRLTLALESANGMRRPAIVIGVMLGVFSLSFLVTSVVRHPTAGPSAGGDGPQLVDFGLERRTFADGDAEGRTNAPHIVFIASLTNRSRVPIYLRGIGMACQDERGREFPVPRWGAFRNWKGTTNGDALLPKAVAKLQFPDYAVPQKAKRFRLLFQYFFDAGPLTKAASQVVTNLPVGKLSPESRYRLYQRGLLNGQCQRTYEGNWVSNESAQRTGASPFAGERGSEPP